ncbi:uncharacterized protein CIMG_12383 [Coccidioides immitis RS]|uniref:Uncharacterized protein n=1 Tax=Coccidioides immitis (strain RS) TaxID=246410 RepID=A0A0D8JYR0_COCIM|nr:uncharacterized protein CIMG_12383 [Coccidioides immitis RS]KJF61398.1 hypothetical protein CIMG_12383 [Coccidioides immitis RS]
MLGARGLLLPPFVEELFGPSGIAPPPLPPPASAPSPPALAVGFLHPLPAVVVPQASASNVVVMVPPARAGWRGVVVLQGAWDHPATPPHRGDRQWWSQATFTPLPPAAFFAGASRAKLVVLPGLPPFVHL